MKPASTANRPRPRGWMRYRMMTRLDTTVSLGLALLVLVLLNVLAHRIPWRHDFNPHGAYQLSDNTHRMLDDLPHHVEITVMLPADHQLADATRSLLREYNYASRKISVTYLDPHRDLIRVRSLAEEHELEGSNLVLFESGDRQRVVDVESIVEYDYLPMLYGEPRRIKAFHGESAFSSAIHTVSDLTSAVVYVLRGYDERDLNDPHPVSGYSKLARLMLDEQVELRELRIADAGGVPDDADMLLILGPRQRLPAVALDRLNDYLERRGRLMVLLDRSESGLESLLEQRGSTVADGRVGGITLSGTEVFVGQYGEHSVTRNLTGVTTVFYQPRPLFRNEFTSDNAVSERLRVSLLATGRELLDSSGEKVLQADPATAPAVAAAVEKIPLRGFNEQHRQTRIIVFSDVDFVSNTGLVAGNPLFFRNAMNWLLQRDLRLDIASRLPETEMLLLPRPHLLFLLLIAGVAIPALFLLLGLAVRVTRGSAAA